jgi:hypothetical protein
MIRHSQSGKDRCEPMAEIGYGAEKSDRIYRRMPRTAKAPK